VPSHILYIVALPKSSVKSIAFKSEIGKEGLPSGSTPDLETFAQRLVGKLAHLPREQQCHGRRILLTQTHLSSLGRMNHASADCAVAGVISVDVLVAFGPKSASSGRAAVATRMFSARGVRGTSWCPSGKTWTSRYTSSTAGQSIADPRSSTRRRTAVTSESPAARARILACSRARSRVGGQASSAHSSRRATNPFTE
jgi:hypothetical protein